MNTYKRRRQIIIFLIILIILIVVLISLKSCWSRHPSPQPYILLYLHNEHRVIEMPIDRYITGVVAAEMPASFELEALKAQAVCARTYALRKILDNKDYPLQADLSDDINECQAFINREQFMSRHPDKSEEYWEKIRQAVKETRGEIMLYDNYPINALYHSTCGGRTAGAEDVWGVNYAYLQSVKCEYCQASAYYHKRFEFSNEEIAACFGGQVEKADLVIESQTKSGRSKEIKINGQIFSAARVRSKLKLPSTWIKISQHNKKIVIDTRGYGHGVGMCQYGANGMALAGHNYHEILHKYYQEIEFYKMGY